MTTHPAPGDEVPGLTACRLCADQTLAGRDPAPGGQLGRLRRLADGGLVRLTLSECLDECERGDVVVARPGPRCRRDGARPVWFERLAGDAPTAALAGWLGSGGPGVAPLPRLLREHVIARASDGPSSVSGPTGG